MKVRFRSAPAPMGPAKPVATPAAAGKPAAPAKQAQAAPPTKA